jgi:hypothetical protein
MFRLSVGEYWADILYSSHEWSPLAVKGVYPIANTILILVEEKRYTLNRDNKPTEPWRHVSKIAGMHQEHRKQQNIVMRIAGRYLSVYI